MAEEPLVTVKPFSEGATLVETDKGHVVPPGFTATFDDPARPFEVVLYVGVAEDDHRPFLLQLTAKPRPMADRWRPPTSGDLRLPLTWILETAERVAAQAVRDQQERSAELGRSTRRARRTLTSALLLEVADVVIDAKEKGLPIRRAVQENFRLGSERTARNWIAAAKNTSGNPLHKKEED